MLPVPRTPKIPLALGLVLALGGPGPLAARRLPERERPTMPRPTERFPLDYTAPDPVKGPVLSECTTPMILIGQLEMPRERGGVAGRDLRPAPSFDGLPVQAPGFFRMMRAEDGIGTSRGPGGILGLRDPMLLRGHFVSRFFKEKRPPWVAPGLEEERTFSAGSVHRTPFVRLTMTPRNYMAHLLGRDAKLHMVVENPTRYPIPDITVRLVAESQHTGFAMERRMTLEKRWNYEIEASLDLSARQRERLTIQLPGKPDRALYQEIERSVLAGTRWPYPRRNAGHPVRQGFPRAGEDLESLLPQRTLHIASGEVTSRCRPTGTSPVVVRYRRPFRAFGTQLDGLDLEVMAAWSKQDTLRFQTLVRENQGALTESMPPLLASVIEAKQRRIPVQRRPGGYDEFDALAMYLWGAIGDGSQGHTGYRDQDDQHYAAQDGLYRNDGVRLPEGQRTELRSRIRGLFGRRSVRGLSAEAARGGPHAYPVDDDHLEGAMRESIYQPENDWVTQQARIRDNRRTRQRRNIRRYHEDEWKALRAREANGIPGDEAARIARGMVSGPDPSQLRRPEPAPQPVSPPPATRRPAPPEAPPPTRVSRPPAPTRAPPPSREPARPAPTRKPPPPTRQPPPPTPVTRPPTVPPTRPAPPPSPSREPDEFDEFDLDGFGQEEIGKDPTPPPPPPPPEDDPFDDFEDTGDQDLDDAGDDFEDDFSDF